MAVVIGLGSAGLYIATGGALTLLFTLMVLGLLVDVHLMAFRSETSRTTRWANHVVISLMLYAVVFALLSEAGFYGAIGDALEAFLAVLGVGLLVPDPAAVWVLMGPALVAAGSDLVASITAVVYGAGLSNHWLGFLFCGILSIRGFGWREFVRYAAVVSVYISSDVFVSLVVL